jgi:hypothetical protein
MSTRKTKVKSSSTRRKANAKLGYGETNKNVNTLRKIEKANADEKETTKSVVLPFEPLSQESLDKGHETAPGLPKPGQHEYGEVGTVYDETHSPESKKHWYLYYKNTKWMTGGFKTKQEAISWYEKKGR